MIGRLGKAILAGFVSIAMLLLAKIVVPPTDRLVAFYEFGTKRYLAIGTDSRKCADAQRLVKGLPGADVSVRGANGTLYRVLRITCIRRPKR